MHSHLFKLSNTFSWKFMPLLSIFSMVLLRRVTETLFSSVRVAISHNGLYLRTPVLIVIKIFLLIMYSRPWNAKVAISYPVDCNIRYYQLQVAPRLWHEMCNNDRWYGRSVISLPLGTTLRQGAGLYPATILHRLLYDLLSWALASLIWKFESTR